VEADVTTPVGRHALLAVAGRTDILVNNAGGPPAGDFRDFSRDDWLAAIDANMLSAVELIKATIDPMIARRFGRIVNVTSGAVKAPISYLALSNGARSGLTGFVAGLAREVSRHNVTINNLLPGSFETDRLLDTARTQAVREGLSEEEQLARWRAGEVSGRFGKPEEFGAVCAFLCSTHAGYITGQNLLMDGGTYPGTF
jgi:3-oxoacyl-[acyl-carrier protein] reductase